MRLTGVDSKISWLKKTCGGSVAGNVSSDISKALEE